MTGSAQQLQIVIRTVIKDTTPQGGSENKFYRTYEVPGYGALAQWGSARTGVGGGQVKWHEHPATARELIRKKQIDGYDGWPDQIIETTHEHIQQYTHPQSQSMAKGLLGQFEWLLRNQHPVTPWRPAAEPAAEPEPAPTPTPTGSADRIVTLNERALRALTLAGDEPAAAITEYALLSGELDELEADVRKVRSYLATLEALLSS